MRVRNDAPHLPARLPTCQADEQRVEDERQQQRARRQRFGREAAE